MGDTYDVVVVGGGAVGCAVLFHLTNQGYKCQLLEKNKDLLAEASCGNSGMLHTGFDAPKDTLELSCIKTCQSQVFDLMDRLGVPYKRVGATMVAWNQEEGERLKVVKAYSDSVDIPNVIPITMSELYKMEPHLRRNAHSALWIPGETVTEPWRLPISLAHHAYKRGAQIRRGCKVERCDHERDGSWIVWTNQGTVKCKVVINCAGLHGDSVDKLIGKDHFQIHPVKGQYIVYSKKASVFISSSILPVPSPTTKGIILFNSVHKNLIFGPTAEPVASVEIPPLDNAVKDKLITQATRIVPSLEKHSIIGGYTGVRPATKFKDYQIICDSDKHWITVGGIRSTGVSGSLGIAEYVGEMVRGKLCLEPTNGRSLQIEKIDLQFLPSNKMALVDDCVYRVTHLITEFGHSITSCL